MTNAAPINVGIAGLGRSGWGIHGGLLEQLKDKYAIVAVFDQDDKRLTEAKQKWGCNVYGRYKGMLAEPNVEMIVVAMPSFLHAKFSIQALRAGKHVVCEKPMASKLSEADRMIKTADASGKVFTIFQNRRYEPCYQKIKEVVKAGTLGRIVEIKMNGHSFGRRWDWQTLKKFGGGSLRNNGPHMLDQLLDLMDVASGQPLAEPKVWCWLDRALTLGDADDHVKIILQAPNGTVGDMELTSACAYKQEPWLIMGTQGNLAGGGKELRWKYFNPAELPSRQVSDQPTPDRSYNSEPIPWKEETWKEDAQNRQAWGSFYDDLYQTIRAGAPLVIKPQEVRRQMAVIEKCMKQSPIYRSR
jgi:scyllo-inositol 2-dehydrogenase (NADP+)